MIWATVALRTRDQLRTGTFTHVCQSVKLLPHEVAVPTRPGATGTRLFSSGLSIQAFTVERRNPPSFLQRQPDSESGRR